MKINFKVLKNHVNASPSGNNFFLYCFEEVWSQKRQLINSTSADLYLSCGRSQHCYAYAWVYAVVKTTL